MTPQNNVVYVTVCQYKVRKEKLGEFIAAYGPAGEWVRLFSGASGYLGTELFRDRSNQLRFITIDRWESEEAFREFRKSNASAYEALDEKCGDFTLDETHLGSFESVR